MDVLLCCKVSQLCFIVLSVSLEKFLRFLVAIYLNIVPNQKMFFFILQGAFQKHCS